MKTQPAPNPNFLKKLRLGKQYMSIYPLEPKLGAIFPENRMIKATRFGIRFMPPIAVFILAWQMSLNGELGPAVATALFACSLPIQGLWWLGKRASTPLPVSLLTWFYEIREKFVAAGLSVAPIENQPTYLSLAELLKKAFKQLDRSFIEDI
nr:terminus macrodomain insulation protein YfbV [uncultured Moellerella sp.]